MPEWNLLRADDLVSRARQVALVHDLVTVEPFDYFSSARDAKAHAENEGIDPRRLKVVGHDNYTRVPRHYPVGLENFIGNTFEALEGHEPQSFLHLDRYKITAGRTPAGKGYDQSLDLVVPSHGRSCSVRLRSCDFVQFNLIPRQDFNEPMHASSSSPLELPLGRNVLGDWTGPESEDRAIRDSMRDWEKVLVVGDRAVRSFIDASLGSFDIEAQQRGGLGDQQRQLSFGLGAAETGLDKIIDVS